MKKRELASLACRFFSLGLAYEALVALPSFVRLVFRPPGEQTWWQLLVLSLQVIALVGLAFLLWRKAGRVATWMVLRLEVSANDEQPSLRDLHGIALSVLALFVITNAIAQLTGLFLALILSRRYQYQYFDFAMRVLGELSPRERLVAWIARMALGVGLFLGSRWLVALLTTAQPRGLRKDAETAA